jgi:hypothetical protein
MADRWPPAGRRLAANGQQAGNTMAADRPPAGHPLATFGQPGDHQIQFKILYVIIFFRRQGQAHGPGAIIGARMLRNPHGSTALRGGYRHCGFAMNISLCKLSVSNQDYSDRRSIHAGSSGAPHCPLDMTFVA